MVLYYFRSNLRRQCACSPIRAGSLSTHNFCVGMFQVYSVREAQPGEEERKI